jgi:hypothetical protein
LRPARVAADPALASQVAEARKRFATVFLVLTGFLVGALGGALAYAVAGPWSACLAILAVAGLIAWSARRGGSDPV